jgi:hypothetical protein
MIQISETFYPEEIEPLILLVNDFCPNVKPIQTQPDKPYSDTVQKEEI